MVTDQLANRGITSSRVLAAFARVPREAFVLPGDTAFAYADRPLSIGCGVTISQPYIVAATLEAANVLAGDRVLEIGTGSGYQTALLVELGAEIYTVEVIPELAAAAQQTLVALGYRGINYRVGDGHKGWPTAMPFAKIILSASPTTIPQALLAQLTDGGVLVGPEGDDAQWLVRIRKHGTRYDREQLQTVRFVPMVSASAP